MPKKYRKPWIKLWCENLLYGTTSRELEPAERWVFVSYLAMGGSSPTPGDICIAPGVPYTQAQRAEVAKVDLETLQSAERKMIAASKITINGDLVQITNFAQYQAIFDRDQYMRDYMRDYMRQKRLPLPELLPEATQLEQQPKIPKVIQPGEETTGQEEPTYQILSDILAKLTANYEKEIGLISAIIANQLVDFAHLYHQRDAPLNWIDQAFAEAASNNIRKWSYVKAILNTWMEQGRETKSAPQVDTEQEEIAREWDKRQEEYLKANSAD